MMIVYKSKTSLIIKLLFVAVIIVLLVFTIVEKSWGLFFMTVGILAVSVYLFSTTHYTVYKNKLTIKSGFIFKETVNINTITSIKPLRKNILSGPGFSAQRLMINYNDHDCVIISPNLLESFINHLKSINPDIIIKS